MQCPDTKKITTFIQNPYINCSCNFFFKLSFRISQLVLYLKRYFLQPHTFKDYLSTSHSTASICILDLQGKKINLSSVIQTEFRAFRNRLSIEYMNKKHTSGHVYSGSERSGFNPKSFAIKFRLKKTHTQNKIAVYRSIHEPCPVT